MVFWDGTDEPAIVVDIDPPAHVMEPIAFEKRPNTPSCPEWMDIIVEDPLSAAFSGEDKAVILIPDSLVFIVKEKDGQTKIGADSPGKSGILVVD